MLFYREFTSFKLFSARDIAGGKKSEKLYKVSSQVVNFCEIFIILPAVTGRNGRIYRYRSMKQKISIRSPAT